jgi:hypothetical protein
VHPINEVDPVVHGAIVRIQERKVDSRVAYHQCYLCDDSPSACQGMFKNGVPAI